jgi:hypothetical protein
MLLGRSKEDFKMKIKNLAFLGLILTAASAHADWCSDSVEKAVANQANIDFPNQALTVEVPTFTFDGGRVQSLDVPVQNSADQTVATYGMTIDEVCSVELQGQEK